jgi:hypothetical protein
MTDDLPITDDLEYVFQRRSSAPMTAVLLFVGGFVALAFAALGMLLAIISNANQLSVQVMTTVPTLIGLAALTAGWSTVRAPTEVTVGPGGLTVTGRKGKQTTPWERIGWATIGTGALNQKRYLVVYDVDGKTITKISQAFDDFDGFAEMVKQRIDARNDDATGRVRLQKSRRAALLAIGIGVFLLAVAGANIWMAHEEQRTSRLLAKQGAPGEADVVRRFLAPDGMTCRLEYRVTSPAAANDIRNAEVSRDYWDSLEEVETVPVIVVPDEPAISRLVEGEVDDDDPTTSPYLMYVLSAVIAVISLISIGVGILQWCGWDIDLNSGKLSIKRIGTGT